MTTGALWIVGGVVAIVCVVAVQTRRRAVRLRPGGATVVLRWVLLAYGVLLVVLVIRSTHSTLPLTVTGLLAALAALAVGLGILRGVATRVWPAGDRGVVYRRGGITVIALWAVSLGAHLLLDWRIDRYDAFRGLGPTTILAYLVITIAAQNITVRRRAAAIATSTP